MKEKLISDKNEIKYLLVILVLSSILYFWNLGHISLWDTDETLYARIAQEMTITGDYITTQWNFTPWFCHPPLYFWMMIISSKIFGWTEFAARFPSAFFSILTAILIFRMGKKLSGSRTGFYSALVFITTLQVWLQSRMALLDMPFVFFIVLSTYCWYVGNSTNNRYLSIAFWASAGLACLTKGPVGLIMPLFYIFLGEFVEGNFKKPNKENLKNLFCLPGILIFLLIVFPWHIIMIYRYGRPFIDNVFGYFFLDRIFKPIMYQGGAWYYYIPFLAIGLLPWTPFLPFVNYVIFREIRDKRGQMLLLSGTITFIVFSLAGTKLPNYLIFLYPGISLMIGLAMGEFSSDNHYRKIGVFSAYFFSFCVLFIVLIAGIVGQKLYPQYWEEYGRVMAPQGIMMLIFGLIIPVFTAMRKRMMIFYSIIAMTCLSFLFLISYYPVVEGIRPELKFIRIINERKTPDDSLIVYNNLGTKNSLLFYTDMPLETYVEEYELIKMLKDRQPAFVVMPFDRFYIIEKIIRNPDLMIKEGNILLLKINP